jgi:hypothetical protein
MVNGSDNWGAAITQPWRAAICAAPATPPWSCRNAAIHQAECTNKLRSQTTACKLTAHCKLCAEVGLLLCRRAVEQLCSGKSNGPGHCRLRISCLGKASNTKVEAIFRAEARRPAATA